MILTTAQRAAAAALVFMVAGCGEPPVITNPAWLTKPDAAAMQAAWPTFANMAGLSGRAEMLCTASAAGTLSRCRVTRAAPTGVGFESAAMGLMPRFKLRPRTVDGEAEGTQVRFTVVFALAKEPTPPAWTGRRPSATALEITRMMARGNAPLDRKAAREEDMKVDPDRREAVVAMVDKAFKAHEAETVDAMALAMARALTPAQVDMLAHGRMPSRLPTADEVVAAGPEMAGVTGRISDAIKADYCAAYECSDVLKAEQTD